MNIEAIRAFVHDHPDGVRIRMIDGRKFDVPHRDYISFGPPRDTPEARRGAHATSFIVWDREAFSLINALLVAELTPLKASSNGHGKKGRSKKN